MTNISFSSRISETQNAKSSVEVVHFLAFVLQGLLWGAFWLVAFCKKQDADRIPLVVLF